MGRDAGVTHKSAPVRQRIGPRNATGWQMPAQVGPRFQRGGEALCDRRNVEQHRFATLLNGKPAKRDGVHTRGTQQLGGGAEVVETVTLLTEAKSHADFLVTDSHAIWRKCRIEVPPVVIRPALDGDLEQPIGNALACATEVRDAPQQPGNMRNLAQLVGERRCERLFLQVHDVSVFGVV